jgi:putative phosphoesterase
VKIGIISDTHKRVGRAKKAIDKLLEEGAEYIIHGGDIVKREILDYLEESGVVYIAVYGNNDRELYQYHDSYNLVQEPYYFKIRDLTFKLMHHPYFMTPDTDIVIYGHLHIFHIQKNGKSLFINPGETCAREKPISQAVLLEIDADSYSVKLFERKLKHQSWSEKSYSFSREVSIN